MTKQWFVVGTVQVWSGLDILWNQPEHQGLWVEHVSHTLHLRCHRSPCKPGDLLLSERHWTEAVPSRHAVTDRKLHRHQHLCTTRFVTVCVTSYCEVVWAETSVLCVLADCLCRSVVCAFCCRHSWKSLFRSFLHDCLALHHRALPHSRQVSYWLCSSFVKYLILLDFKYYQTITMSSWAFNCVFIIL